ncbi:probable histone-lysine N-methyltransferase CG1716 isoform X2 [Bradysia coprophila]|uniref:probable histone-lysine N-methyltransferase CG1716 isoform X2 n=1 Tax=Bradysia coprophila TaxID=38358 RepID=UPI00187DD76C|nr:probable histone-lysine N-methyltransferase CG1716 isoform X2 [Bradysia coprophila]
MDEQHANLKSTNVKKVTPPPVESSINQRPRRSIKHKFIKCNRDSPEKSFGAETSTEVTTNAENVFAPEPDTSCPSTSHGTVTKAKTQQKSNSKKNARQSGRQNRCKEVEDSNLQMVEIIDDPSDDPNVSIEEIIETCVLDAEEYQRMVACSKDAVSTDSSSNTSNTVTCATDLSEESSQSKSKTNYDSICKQNSCDKQISVGLVDCMKSKNYLKRLNDERSKTTASGTTNTFEGVLSASIDDSKEIAITDVKPTVEFNSPIRTRRVTRLSSMYAHRPTDAQLGSPIRNSPKIKFEAAQPSDTTQITEQQTHSKVELLENVSTPEDVLTRIESSDEIKCEDRNEILVSSTEPQVNTEDFREISSEKSNDELCTAAEVDTDSIEISNEVEVQHLETSDSPIQQAESIQSDAQQSIDTVAQNSDSHDIVAPTILEQLKCDTEIGDTVPVSEVKSGVEPARIEITSQESESNDQPANDEKTKEKLKSKKGRKRTSDKATIQPVIAHDKQQSPPTIHVPEHQSMEPNKIDSVSFVEKKSRDSYPSKQTQRTASCENEDNTRKQNTSGDIAKTEKSKKKRESSSGKDKTAKRPSDSSKTTEKPSDLQSTHKSSDSQSTHKSSSSKSWTDRKSRDFKDGKPVEPKTKSHSSETDLSTKKSHKRDSNKTEKDIIMNQLRLLEQKAANRSKSASHHESNKETLEKPREPPVKSAKAKPIPDATKIKSKPKETVAAEPKDDKPSNSKSLSDTVSANRKNQQAVSSTSRSSTKSNRCGTDSILSECYLPKQVKYDESLYSIEALKAAQAAQEEQMKADAEAAKKAREILAVKEEQAKAARAAARLAKAEAEKAEAEKAAKIEAEKAAKVEAEKMAKAEAEKAAKLARKAARSKQAKENANKSNDSPSIENFGLFATKDDSQESHTSSPGQDFIPENFKNSAAFVQYQSHDQLQSEIQTNEIIIKADETIVPPVDEEETNIRRSGRIKTITETKQRACGFGLVKDKDKFHSIYAGDLSYSSMSDSQYMSDYNSSNSNSLLDLSEIGKDLEMEPVVAKRQKTAEELEAEKADVAAGLSLFKQIVDCEYRSERTISKETKKMTCDCFLTKSEIERGELGCGEDCLNRLIFIECGSRCTIGDRCTNKRFQRHQNSDCSIFRAGKKGFGMKAVSVIEAGEFIMEYVGEVLNSKQFDERRFKYSNDNIQHHYFMALRSDCVIDATIKGNISRFINHSCDPNAETQKWTVNGELRIGFFSTRTIQPDEEITFDYQFQRYGKEAQRCYCEAENCRGWIGEEPDSEEEEDEEEEEYDEEEGEDESEEETPQIEEKVTPLTTELPGPETIDENKLTDPITSVKQEDINDKLPVDEKPILPIKKEKPASPVKKVRKPKLEPKPKKFKIKKAEIMEDPDLDHEIANLMKTNLKNQAHTLRFSRLMVRAKMLDARSKLLNILRNGEIACRRLFLDYHGLKLLHTWMCDAVTKNAQQEWGFRLEILETLDVLPIPNKNMLQDSKVIVVVQKWANTKSMKESVKSPEESPSDSGSGTPISDGNSPQVEEAKNVDSVKIEELEHKEGDAVAIKVEHDLCKTEAEVTDSSKAATDSSKETADPSKVADALKDVRKEYEVADKNDSVATQIGTGEDCADDELMEQIHLLTAKLLEAWEVLKEVFRIPKKLRIEQMKEHEQEANRNTESEDSSKRNGDSAKEKEKFRKEKRTRQTDPTDPETLLLKAQRRRLFEATVATQSIDKRNHERQIEAIHVAKCKYFQLDPRTTSYRAIPFSVSPLTGQWYARDGNPIATPPSHIHIKPPQELPTNPDEYELPPMDLPPQWKFAIDVKGRLYYYHVKIRIPQWDPPIKILPLRDEPSNTGDNSTELSDDNEIDGKDDSLIVSSNPNEIDSEKEDDSDVSSDAVDSSEDELLQKRQQLLNSFQANQTDLDISANLAVEISAMATVSDKSSMDDSMDLSFNLDNSLMHSVGKKKNRDGLATERLISPRTEEERLQGRIESQRYRQNKEKMKRRKEKLRQQNSSEPSRKLKKLTEGLPVVSQQDDDLEETDDEDESNASLSDLEVSGVLNAKFVDELDGIKSDKLSNRPDQLKMRLDALRSNRKVTKRKRNEPEPIPHNSNEAAKRIKEKFCAEMSGVIVQHLGPYRKDDCRRGRIKSNDDFKHLARKLTHFVMLKELKHCDNTVTVLEVTDSVRAKSKEFIRKYMAKFGDVYVKPDNDPEYKEFCNT